MEKEIFRAKEENFQDLLDFRRNTRDKLGGGCTTIRRDYSTGEYVLIHTSKNWGACVADGTAQMNGLIEDFENYLAKGEDY